MKHRMHFFLVCCLVTFAHWSTAQIGFLAAINHASKTTPAVGDPGAGEPGVETSTIPAGTRLLMRLISPLHTTSATPGSGVYLETAFPVVANSRVVIPEHTRVLGVVTDERRPGRVQGRAQMQLRFTQLILPDNRELSLVGNLQSLPGSNRNRTNNEGTLEPVDQIDADVYTMVKTTGLGTIAGALSHASLAGAGYGALIGGGVGLAKILFTRGNEISLPVGTRVEMVLHHPLTVQSASRSTLAVYRSPDRPEESDHPSIPKEQNTPQRRDDIPCLRDGVTFRCVTSETATVSQVEPVTDR